MSGATINMQVIGMDEVVRKFRNLPENIRKAETEKVFRAASRQMLKALRAAAPVANKVIKRYSGGKVAATYTPGNLGRSIGYLPTKDKMKFYTRITPLVGYKRKNDGYYAHFIEGGTDKMTPKPWFHNTANQQKGATVNAMGVSMQKIIDRYFKKKGLK